MNDTIVLASSVPTTVAVAQHSYQEGNYLKGFSHDDSVLLEQEWEKSRLVGP